MISDIPQEDGHLMGPGNLSNCPFCESPQVFVLKAADSNALYVWCMSCNGRGPSNFGKDDLNYHIQVWNKASGALFQYNNPIDDEEYDVPVEPQRKFKLGEKVCIPARLWKSGLIVGLDYKHDAFYYLVKLDIDGKFYTDPFHEVELESCPDAGGGGT